MTGQGATVGVLVMAHGTPERMEDLPRFYEEVRHGRPPSPEQLTELRARYEAIGNRSPLNAITEAQAAGVALALEQRAPGRFVVRHGLRFAQPRIEQALAALADTGVSEMVGLVLAPHSSRASVSEYARRAADAASRLGMTVHVVEHWYDAPGFAGLVADRVQSALRSLPEDARHEACTVFTAHSIPAAMVGAGDDYPEQVAASAALVAGEAGLHRWAVAWQSAGRTDDEWLGPDVRHVISTEAASGASAVVVCPIGFVSDHLEILYDVDVECATAAAAEGIPFARTASFNDDADLCGLLAAVVVDTVDAVFPADGVDAGGQ